MTQEGNQANDPAAQTGEQAQPLRRRGELAEGTPPAAAPAAEGPATAPRTPRAPRAPRGEAGAGAAPARGQRAPRGQASGGSAAVAEPEKAEPLPPPRLREMYRTQIVPAMMQEFGYATPMRVPQIKKIVLNIGLGEALTNARAMESALRDLATITGQKPIATRARKSIANFKLRQGNPIGAAVTLRGPRMYYFLDRLVNMALPRIRDFRGIPRTGFDGRGNFSLGMREQVIFPEIDYNQIDKFRGFQVTFTTSAQNDAEAMRLLELFGMPFVRQT
ncbi:MAG: 50S ribosomal protein L5 [Dehalococcoidia bacterium]|nr:50S ribosomal protein L5 [Dehalococcoidia bacterium]